MLNESREAWPPGAFGPSEITASSVDREDQSSGKLFSIIALQGERVVGICRTCPYGGELHASYVDFLNVVPDMHGKGVGKALLLDAVDRSVECGMKRIDLHTWPANMKALPLYKKTGFFWIPETQVYMQNYMPLLLGRKDFLEFLSGAHWYSCFQRALTPAPDAETAESGREVFRYVFTRNNEKYTAEFDRRGRCLSRIEYPGFFAGLSVEPGSGFFTGKPCSVTLFGSGFDRNRAQVRFAESLECTGTPGDSFSVVPLPVRMPKNADQPADCITVNLPDADVELGLGITGEEEVSLYGTPVRFLLPGEQTLEIGLKKNASLTSVCLRYAMDGGEFYERIVPLSDDIFQNCTLELPAIEPGIHTVSVQAGESGFMETVVLIAGIYCGEPSVLDTRNCAVIVGKDVVLTIARKGASTAMWTRGENGRPLKLAEFFISAGPPASWNSDLPKQIYSMEFTGGGIVTASTSWPSRPGMTHFVDVRLDPAGYPESRAGVRNSSKEVQNVSFRVSHRFCEAFEPKTDLIPLAKGLLVEPRVYNQVPDWEEDLTSRVDSLAAPWHGVTNSSMSVMSCIEGWTVFEYDMPGTADTGVEPGETLMSPFFRMLYCEGGVDSLMRKAENLGWELGNWREKTPFLCHDLTPVMTSGAAVSLTHPLHGVRKGEILAGGKQVCCGDVHQGASIAGEIHGKGVVDVSLIVAERSTVLPVYLVKPSESVFSGREQEFMRLSNGKIDALIDPASVGHVYSVKREGVEYILASHPESSEFAWEKPWFGGIHPRILDENSRPFLLQNHSPIVEGYETVSHGLVEKGWKLSWKVNHWRWGSLEVNWKVGLLPGVPVMKTSLECIPSSKELPAGEMELRGFMQPGGSVQNTVLTCESFPGLEQGREHSGAWAQTGRWARVARDHSFIEVYPGQAGVSIFADHGQPGCHFCMIGSLSKDRNLEMILLFGTDEEDRALATVYRAIR